MRYNKIFAIITLLLVLACERDQSSEPSTTGEGGSMTRFAISGDKLYIVDHSSIKVFGIQGKNFSSVNEVSVDPGIETIFAKGQYLYLGTTSAMYIFSIADPDNPTFIFRYEHIYSCDPVIVQGDRAYVTLRAGGRCNRGTNTLEVLNISDRYNPKLLRSYEMSSPYGLAIDDKLLMVCEGDGGVKIFDAWDATNLIQVKNLAGFSAYDVIMKDGVATITGEDGIFQYAYSTPAEDLKLLSVIPVTRTQR